MRRYRIDCACNRRTAERRVTDRPAAASMRRRNRIDSVEALRIATARGRRTFGTAATLASGQPQVQSRYADGLKRTSGQL
jgi:hypothetical protein